MIHFFFFFSSRRRHTRFDCDWSSDVCSSDLVRGFRAPGPEPQSHRRFRIGVPKGVIDAVQGEVAENFTVTLDVLRAIAEIVPDVELPDLPFGVVGGTIIAAEGGSAFADLLEVNRLKEPTT